MQTQRDKYIIEDFSNMIWFVRESPLKKRNPFSNIVGNDDDNLLVINRDTDPVHLCNLMDYMRQTGEIIYRHYLTGTNISSYLEGLDDVCSYNYGNSVLFVTSKSGIFFGKIEFIIQEYPQRMLNAMGLLINPIMMTLGFKNNIDVMYRFLGELARSFDIKHISIINPRETVINRLRVMGFHNAELYDVNERIIQRSSREYYEGDNYDRDYPQKTITNDYLLSNYIVLNIESDEFLDSDKGDDVYVIDTEKALKFRSSPK